MIFAPCLAGILRHLNLSQDQGAFDQFLALIGDLAYRRVLILAILAAEKGNLATKSNDACGAQKIIYVFYA